MTISIISPLCAGDGSLDSNAHSVAVAHLQQNKIRLENQAYADALRCLIPNCVDAMVINREEMVLMGCRVNEPWRGHWHPSGGRQELGTTYHETASRHVERDLGIVVAPDRFEYVNSASFPWSTSAQGVPCHLNGILMAVMLTDIEFLNHKVQETGDFSKQETFHLCEVTESAGFHPAIALGARMMLSNLKHHNRLGTIDPELLASR